MEKLKAKHDHKLTDILKVAIFGLMLILPGLILLPSMLYYGVNEYATAPTEQVEKIEYERVDFNQIVNPATKSPNIVSYDNLTYTYLTNSYNEQTVFNFNSVNVNNGDKYYYRYTILNASDSYLKLYNGSVYLDDIVSDTIYTSDYTGVLSINLFYLNSQTEIEFKCNIFNLTQMFGSGNEPTYSEFISYYPNYYEYTESRYEILEIKTGTYETYTDITSQIQYNWNSLWQQPLFSWTNYTIVKQGIDNFTGVFGITNTSNIANLIAYELIIVAIYIVIDIVLTLFKWLTHLIGEK